MTDPTPPPPAPAPRRRALLVWSVGFVLAAGLSWGVTLPFVGSVMTYRHDPAVGRLVPTPGQAHLHTKEGWGTTRFGRYGVGGVEDLGALGRPVVAVWGDSHIEALQVDDPDKVGAQLTRLCGGGSLVGVGIGESGWKVADYPFLLPRYDKLMDVPVHYIVVGEAEDLVPDGRRFRTDPLELRELHPPRSLLGMRELVSRLHLELPWRAVRTALTGPDGRRRIRLRPGPVAQSASGSDHDRAAATPPREVLAWLVRRVRDATPRPVAFVYAPQRPQTFQGKIQLEDQDEDLVALLASVASELGVGLLDLRPAFRREWEERGRFARGFHNGMPSRGHYNPLGHRLLAEALCADLKRRGALHTD